VQVVHADTESPATFVTHAVLAFEPVLQATRAAVGDTITKLSSSSPKPHTYMGLKGEQNTGYAWLESIVGVVWTDFEFSVLVNYTV